MQLYLPLVCIEFHAILNFVPWTVIHRWTHTRVIPAPITGYILLYSLWLGSYRSRKDKPSLYWQYNQPTVHVRPSLQSIVVVFCCYIKQQQQIVFTVITVRHRSILRHQAFLVSCFSSLDVCRDKEEIKLGLPGKSLSSQLQIQKKPIVIVKLSVPYNISKINFLGHWKKTKYRQ